jgi:hypothetical protein
VHGHHQELPVHVLLVSLAAFATFDRCVDANFDDRDEHCKKQTLTVPGEVKKYVVREAFGSFDCACGTFP